MTHFILWGTTVLFFLRVSAQLIQWLAPRDLLPPFEQFHSAILPYPVLLGAQLLILSLMVFVNLRVHYGWRPATAAVRWLFGIGALYFFVMLFRLVAGLLGWIDAEWFQRPIPAFFHLILATYIISLACVSNRAGKELA